LRKLLGRFVIDEQLEQEFLRSGMLEVRFVDTRSDVTLVSLDGAKSILWLTPSGGISGVLVQDYAPDESRVVPFEIGEIEIEADGDELRVFLRQTEPG
jgi:hypothetical protein